MIWCYKNQWPKIGDFKKAKLINYQDKTDSPNGQTLFDEMLEYLAPELVIENK